MRLRDIAIICGLGLAVLPAAVEAHSIAAGPSVSTYELHVVNKTSSDIKHIYTTAPSGEYLGDRLKGRIVANTSVVIDLGTASDPCGIGPKTASYTLRAVLYDDRVAERRLDLCSTRTWTIEESGELDD